MPFEPHPMSFHKRDQRSPEFLAINPEGKLQTLVIDGRPLTEVAAILYYLARRYPEKNLFPADDPEAEAQAISWMSFIASSLHPARRQGLDHVKTIYGIADKRLGQNQWAIGRYSIADIHLFRLYWRILGSLKPEPGTFPNLQRHHDQMMQRSAVKRTLEAERAVGYELPA